MMVLNFSARLIPTLPRTAGRMPDTPDTGLMNHLRGDMSTAASSVWVRSSWDNGRAGIPAGCRSWSQGQCGRWCGRDVDLIRSCFKTDQRSETSQPAAGTDATGRRSACG